jgi:PST family polysaccharide transporter
MTAGVHHRRLSLTLASGITLDLANKLIPIYLLHYAQSRLGLEAFGFAQFAISLIEIMIPFVIMGYNQYGTLEVGRLRESPFKLRSLLTHLSLIKFVNAIVVSGLFLTACYLTPRYSPYMRTVTLLSVSLLLSSIDTLWMQYGIQKVALINLFNIIGKIVSLVSIVLFVSSPEDSTAYAFLTLLANMTTTVLSLAYSFYHYPPVKPRWDEIRRLMKSSQKYALIVMGLILFERIDMLITEHYFSTTGAGLYSGPMRINHSFMQFLHTIGAAFFAELLAVRDRKLFSRHIELATWSLMTVIAPIICGTWFVSQDILVFIFDEKFAVMDSSLWILLVSSLLHIFIVLFGTQVLLIHGQVKQVIVYMFIGITALVLSAQLFCPSLGLPGVAVAVLIGKAVTLSLILIRLKPYLERYPVREFVQATVPALLMMVYLLALEPQGFLLTVVHGALSFAIFTAIINRRIIGRFFSQIIKGR